MALTIEQIALDTFIDNVAVLGVEMCLLTDLGDIFPVEEVASMDDERLVELASEPAGTRLERTQARAQAYALQNVIRICERFVGHGHSTSHYS
jgi:hypothetical protein